MTGFQLIPLVFVAVGALLAVLGVRNLRASNRFIRTAGEASGEVTDVRTRAVGHGSDSNLAHFPVVRFQLPDGRVVEAETDTGVNFKRPRAGQPVTVLYDPADPTHARIAGSVSGALRARLPHRLRGGLRPRRARVLRALPGVRRRALMGGDAYTVRRPRVGAIAPLLILPVFLVATRALGFPAVPPLFIVLFLAFAAYIAWQRTLVLKVDAGGVRLGRGSSRLRPPAAGGCRGAVGRDPRAGAVHGHGRSGDRPATAGRGADAERRARRSSTTRSAPTTFRRRCAPPPEAGPGAPGPGPCRRSAAARGWSTRPAD